MNLHLTKKQSSLYKKLRIILFLFATLGLIYFAKELRFPTYIFNYFKNSNSLANTVTKPYLTNKGTTFDVSAFGEFDKAKVIIKLDSQAEKLPEKTQLKIRKSYNAFLSPISQDSSTFPEITTYQIEGNYYLLKDDSLYSFISEEAFQSYKNKSHTADGNSKLLEKYPKSKEKIGFADGSLIAVKDDGAYVIENGKRHAIDGTLTQRAFGFDRADDTIYETYVNREELNVHKKASMFNMQDKHPNGTLFYATDTDKYYLYQNDTLYEIEKPDAKLIIPVNNASREIFADCILNKGLTLKYTCTIDLENISEFEGNFYEFSVIDIPELNTKSIKIKLSQKTTRQNFYDRINEVKKGLTTQYGN